MAVSTDWTTITPDFQSKSGSPSVGNGAISFRYRRENGRLLWKFSFEIGTTTVVSGTGEWAFKIADDAAFPVEDTGEDYGYVPATAHVYDASAALASRLRPGLLLPTWSTNITLLEPEIGLEVEAFYLIGVFGTARLSATNPVTFAAGDRIVGGNVFEALST